MAKRDMEPKSRYPYFCGVARNRVNTIAEVAAKLIRDGEI